VKESTQSKPLINEENRHEKQEIMEKGTMPLGFLESLASSKQVLSIKVRYQSANGCKSSEDGTTCEHGSNHGTKENVGLQIHSRSTNDPPSRIRGLPIEYFERKATIDTCL
jgi:hypothetical protein